MLTAHHQVGDTQSPWGLSGSCGLNTIPSNRRGLMLTLLNRLKLHPLCSPRGLAAVWSLLSFHPPSSRQENSESTRVEPGGRNSRVSLYLSESAESIHTKVKRESWVSRIPPLSFLAKCMRLISQCLPTVSSGQQKRKSDGGKAGWSRGLP